MPTADAQEIARPIPGEKSSLPLLVVLAGWLVPGAGHLLLGKWIRAALIFVSVLGMYLTGLSLAGKIYILNPGEILDMLGFVGELGTGIPYILARIFGWGAASTVNTLADYGKAFLIVGGLLNIVAAVDAHSIASGRKASR